MKTSTHGQNTVKVLSKSLLAILIREEIKSRKLASILHELGVEEQCPWLPSFNEAIAEFLGLQTDASFQEYDMLMDLFVNRTSSVNDLSRITTILLKDLKKPKCEVK